ncbi:hypothetical protein Pfo_022627 [Paulownia fortunei]|nr:hypothetical protein Pfo_022627 [Paulownia fortunei]
MASLHLPCASATPSSQSRSSSRHIFAKPSHFITHAKRNNSLRVSCTDGQNKKEASQNVDTPQGKVDRRNMLLGLGGLYGAANLISTPGASANPVQAPELDKCGVATNLNTGQQLDVNCCPPTSQRIIDYRLPPVFQMKLRPSAHRVSPEYIFKYNMAIDRMKRLPADDPRSFMQQANIHCAYCNGAYDQPGQGSLDLQVHNSWLFFPFHRWYLYFYERILGKLIGDPTFALPFWNWDNPKGMTIPPMFLDPKAALYDSKRNQDNLKAVVDLGMTGNKDALQVVANNLTIMYSEMIRGNADVYDFMGQPYREGTAVNPGPDPPSVVLTPRCTFLLVTRESPVERTWVTSTRLVGTLCSTATMPMSIACGPYGSTSCPATKCRTRRSQTLISSMPHSCSTTRMLSSCA